MTKTKPCFNKSHTWTPLGCEHCHRPKPDLAEALREVFRLQDDAHQTQTTVDERYAEFRSKARSAISPSTRDRFNAVADELKFVLEMLDR